MSAQTAKKCFVENINLFANSQSQPEKFNLYNGLANLAQTLEKLERDLDDIDREIRRIKHKIGA